MKPAIGDQVRFHDGEGDYKAHIIHIDQDTVPPLLTVEVHYDTCVVITITTEDDADIIPPASRDTNGVSNV
jgi:hypothetical protein